MSSNVGIKLRDHYDVALDQDTIVGRFQRRMKDPSNDYLLQIAGEKIFIKIPSSRHKWWSPELYLVVGKREGASHIREVLGPNPQVFMLSMFMISLGAVISFFALIVALSQFNLGMSATLFLTIGLAALILIGIVLFIMAIGRRRARPQMQELRDFAASVIHENS